MYHFFENAYDPPICYTSQDIDELKRQFREHNKTDDVIQACGRDAGYERYCDMLNSLYKTESNF